MFLLDTNIVSYFMKNSYPALTRRLMSYDPSAFAISSVTVFEMEYGAVRKNWGEETHRRMLLFLAPFTVVPLETDDAFTAGRVRAVLEKKGTGIGPYDILIASQALTRDYTVITHNAREFRRVPGLKVEDWAEEE